MKERKPNRIIPLIILLFLITIAGLTVYGTMGEQRKESFKNSFKNPFGLNTENTTLEEIPEPELLSAKEALEKANKQIDETNSIYVKTYKNKISFKTVVMAWGYDKKNNVYVMEDKYYIDLNDNIYYYIEDEKWHKKENTEEINVNIMDYKVPTSAVQKEDEMIDGAKCYVFENENKTFYIKQSNGLLSYIKETTDEDVYYKQISYKEIIIRDEIKEKAIE